MSFRTIATLALATGFAAAKPISAPQSKRSTIGGKEFNGAVLNGFSGNGFNFADGFDNFNKQQQVIQIQEQNLQIIDNGFQQQVVQQVNEVLIVDQVNNGFNNDLNNLFRKSNFQNQFKDVSTVMLVVQEIQVAVDDGRGGLFQQNVFAQNVVVANRGAQETQTAMVFDERVLKAQDVLANDAFNNIAAFGGVAGATGDIDIDKAFPTKTQGLQLFGAKPTWNNVVADPAATLGAIWEAALQDLQKNENDEADNKLNELIAAEEKKALDEVLRQLEEQKKKQEEEERKDKDDKDKDDKDKDDKDKDNKDKDNKDKDDKDRGKGDGNDDDENKDNNNEDRGKGDGNNGDEDRERGQDEGKK